MPAWLVVVLIVAGAVVVLVGAVMGASFLAVRRADRDPSLIGASASTVANCVSVSGTDRVVTGTGTLAVFDEEVRFVIAAPRRELRIPRRRLAVTLENRAGGGKRRSSDDAALVLTWNDDGRRCSAEFLVPDPATWRGLLLR